MKYDNKMMKSAQDWAEHSYCKRKKVGAVLSFDGREIASGYNGTVSGLNNDCEGEDGLTKDLVLHAEQNLISYCAKQGISMKDTTMYITVSPCQNCAKLIAQSGVTKVLYGKVYKDDTGLEFLKSVGVSVEQFKKRT